MGPRGAAVLGVEHASGEPVEVAGIVVGDQRLHELPLDPVVLGELLLDDDTHLGQDR